MVEQQKTIAPREFRCIIAGGRYFVGEQKHQDWLDLLHRIYNFTHVLSGNARGADRFGEMWALTRRLRIVQFLADWRPGGVYDPGAGHKRNEQMAVHGHMLAAFPGGKGTADMVRRAKRHKLLVVHYADGISHGLSIEADQADFHRAIDEVQSQFPW